MDFGQHGTLLRSQPLTATPPTDTHSIQTDEKELLTEPGPEAPSSSSRRASDAERHRREAAAAGGLDCDRGCRRHHIALILLAVLLTVVAAIALPLWLVPSGSGLCILLRITCCVLVTRLQLRPDFGSTAIRRPFDCLSKVVKVTQT